MTEVYKMVHKHYDVHAAAKVNFNTFSNTKGNKYKLHKNASRYILRKFSFFVHGLLIFEKFARLSG